MTAAKTITSQVLSIGTLEIHKQPPHLLKKHLDYGGDGCDADIDDDDEDDDIVDGEDDDIGVDDIDDEYQHLPSTDAQEELQCLTPRHHSCNPTSRTLHFDDKDDDEDNDDDDPMAFMLYQDPTIHILRSYM